MKVNNVYAEEIAKWDGDKATKRLLGGIRKTSAPETGGSLAA